MVEIGEKLAKVCVESFSTAHKLSITNYNSIFLLAILAMPIIYQPCPLQAMALCLLLMCIALTGLVEIINITDTGSSKLKAHAGYVL